jgi:hypothetical protein
LRHIVPWPTARRAALALGSTYTRHRVGARNPHPKMRCCRSVEGQRDPQPGASAPYGLAQTRDMSRDRPSGHAGCQA